MGYGGAARVVGLGVVVTMLAVGCGEDGSDPGGTAVSGVKIGKVVEVRADDSRFAARCAGDESAPPVLLVSDMGRDMASAWDSVQGRIGAFARVCAYDRLGVGDSADPAGPQTFDDLALALGDVMDELELERPVVLVAQATGGFVAATYAQLAPSQVAGLVLLDAAGPGFPQRILRRLPRRDSASGGAARNQWEDLLRPRDNPERLDGRLAFSSVRDLGAFGAMPMIALTHSISELGEDISASQAADVESAWEAGQNRWLALSTQGRLERVDLAGSDIAADQPDDVVERVRELVSGL